MELDKSKIEAAIVALETIDLKMATDEELNKLVDPLFNGLKLAAPIIPEGTYIYRGRVCDKPKVFDELIYPKPDQVKHPGRANYIGEPMFYGSMGKSIPFFELRAQKGDTIVLSIWKTTKQLVVNQVGFTKEVGEMLRSNRNLEVVHDFVKQTQEFGELNTFVYNFIGRVFSKRINEETDGDEYKLTKAIARALTFGFIDGIIYPTVAMSGNAENIVLKPASFEGNLQFVSAEFLEVTYREGDEMKFNTLDTAVTVNASNELKWTGMGFAWEGSEKDNISIKHHLGEYIGNSGENERVNPISTAQLYHDVSKLEKRYRRDFPEVYKASKELDISGNGEKVKASYTINMDFKRVESDISFYITACDHPTEAAIYLIGQIDAYLNDPTVPQMVYTNEFDAAIHLTNLDLKFSGRIYIYSENRINRYTLQANTPPAYQISMLSAKDLR